MQKDSTAANATTLGSVRPDYTSPEKVSGVIPSVGGNVGAKANGLERATSDTHTDGNAYSQQRLHEVDRNPYSFVQPRRRHKRGIGERDGRRQVLQLRNLERPLNRAMECCKCVRQGILREQRPENRIQSVRSLKRQRINRMPLGHRREPKKIGKQHDFAFYFCNVLGFSLHCPCGG